MDLIKKALCIIACLTLAFAPLLAASNTAYAAPDSAQATIEAVSEAETTDEEDGGFNLTIFMVAVILLIIVVVAIVAAVVTTTTLPIIEYFE